MTKPILEIQNLTKKFGGLRALADVSLSVDYNERLGLIGPNGSGKTTLINIITGVLDCDEGRIIFDGRDITKLVNRKHAHRIARLGISRTFQIPRPFKSMTVLDNVTVPLLFSKRYAMQNCEETALNILRMVNLEPHAHSFPSKLTQIELRKLELARALAVKPRLLLLDEVGAGLTMDEISELLTLLKKLNEEGLTIIMVEHVMKAVFSFCERVVVLCNGAEIACGKPGEISSNEEVVRSYLGG